MQLQILKLQACSSNIFLTIISPPVLQKSQCYSCISSLFLPLKNKKANKTINQKLKIQHFFSCFFTVISTNFFTTEWAQKTEWWPAAKLSCSVSPRKGPAACRSSHFWLPLFHSHNKQRASYFERNHEKTVYLCYSSTMGLKTSLQARLLKTFNMKRSREVSHRIPESPSIDFPAR